MDILRLLHASVTCGLVLGLAVVILTGSLLFALAMAALMTLAVSFGAALSNQLLRRHHRAPSPSRKDPS